MSELDKIKECLDFFCRRCNEQGFYSPPLQPIVKEAYEAISALRSEPVAWMPIETAPKDGTEIDVWCPEEGGGYRTPDSWWSTADNKWRVAGDCHVTWMYQPTHWMPLPAAPSREQTDEQGRPMTYWGGMKESSRETPVHSKSQYRRVAAQGGNPVLSRETAKPEGAQPGEHPDKKNLPLVNQYGKPVAEPALSAEQNYKSVWKPDELERIIDQYVKHYELNDGETCYDPSDEERIIIKDAIMGLLVDREWDAEWGKHIASLAALSSLTARDEGIEAAAKVCRELGQGWALTNSDGRSPYADYKHDACEECAESVLELKGASHD